MTGGGSGGHITPFLAVAHELKAIDPSIEIIYIGQKGDGLADIPAEDPNIDQVYLIHAGKFRRYHGESVIRQLLDIPTVLKNIRDMFKVGIGFFQSLKLLGMLRPDIIFIKGGFVCVPVGLAAAIRKVPYITHDSDALPGLANRIVAPWAKLHTVGLPKEVYSYPPEKTVTVGVPLMHHFKPLAAKEIAAAKERLGLPQTSKVLLVTGGGGGAKRVNNAVAACVEELLDRYATLTVVHIAGRKQEDSLRRRYRKLLSAGHQKRVIVKGFVTNLYLYSGVADVVITRAGATSMAEFAAQRKACLVIPNPLLTGGHQLKNAQVWADRGAVRIVSEDRLKRDDHALMPTLVDLLDDPARAKKLGDALGALAQPDSAKRLAMLLLEEAA